jgi:hypothetical protein
MHQKGNNTALMEILNICQAAQENKPQNTSEKVTA